MTTQNDTDFDLRVSQLISGIDEAVQKSYTEICENPPKFPVPNFYEVELNLGDTALVEKNGELKILFFGGDAKTSRNEARGTTLTFSVGKALDPDTADGISRDYGQLLIDKLVARIKLVIKAVGDAQIGGPMSWSKMNATIKFTLTESVNVGGKLEISIVEFGASTKSSRTDVMSLTAKFDAAKKSGLSCG